MKSDPKTLQFRSNHRMEVYNWTDEVPFLVSLLSACKRL